MYGIFMLTSQARTMKTTNAHHWLCEGAELNGQRGSKGRGAQSVAQAFYPQTTSDFFQFSLPVDFYRNLHFYPFYHLSTDIFGSKTY